MVKRKKANKMQGKTSDRPKVAASKTMPVPELAIKILAGILGVIMVIAMTLFALGKMPARGFWTLTILILVLAFVVIPVMRKKFVDGQ